MLYLALHVLFNTSFGLLFKWNRTSSRYMYAAGAVNYAVASLVGLAGGLLSGAGAPTRPTWGIGVIAGVSYFCCFALMDINVHRVGISLTWSTIRMAVVLSILLSVVLWGERPAAVQVVGIVLALSALPLLSLRAESSARERTGPLGAGALLILGQFLCGGGNSAAAKWFSEAGPPAQRQLFLAFLFGTAAVGCLLVMVVKRARFHPLDLPAGAAIGICNLLGAHFLLRALEALPGVVVFPVATASSIVLATLAGVSIWRERLGRAGWAGIGMALVSVVLINLG